ncbi:MAG: extracellular matrix regulator RemB [bacterium]
MYLFLGGDTVIREEEIVGIFDFDNATASKWTRKTLEMAERAGQVFETTPALPRSFVLTAGHFGQQIYLTPLTSGTVGRPSWKG